MFEKLTKYLPDLEKASGYGDWVVDHESKGTMDDPIQMPYVNYGRVVMDVERAINCAIPFPPDDPNSVPNDSFTERQLRVIGLLRESTNRTYDEFARELTVSKATVKCKLACLWQRGSIRRAGATRGI